MKISEYTTKRKDKVVSVDKTIYPGDRKRFSISFTSKDSSDRIVPIWKEFDTEALAIEYINAIEKLI